jgi:hypothetical protein
MLKIDFLLSNIFYEFSKIMLTETGNIQYLCNLEGSGKNITQNY